MVEAIRGWHVQLLRFTPTGPVRWRLLSANNREAARSALAFVDVDECRAHITALQRELASLPTRVRRLSATEWVWEIVSDGAVVVHAGRPFSRGIRCQQALALFRRRFAAAPVGAAVIQASARRWSPDRLGRSTELPAALPTALPAALPAPLPAAAPAFGAKVR